MSLELTVLSLRYSSWSIRAWLPLHHAGAEFTTRTVPFEALEGQGGFGMDVGGAADHEARLKARRTHGSVTGLFPVLHVDGEPIHEALAIAEWTAERFPEARLWPADAMERALARSVSCEMASGFLNVRDELSCHVFARVPARPLRENTQAELRRIFELWSEALERTGGPFLFGHFTIPDCMYFPIVTRLRTYSIELPESLEAYAQRLEAHPSVQAWRALALEAPRMPPYDQRVEQLGGDPDGALR